MPVQTHRFRLLDFYAGSRWFSGVVALILIGLFSLWLVASLVEMQERSEKLMVELKIRNIKVGLKVAMLQAMFHGKEGEIPTWVGSNPLRWLGALPESQSGDDAVRATESSLAAVSSDFRGNCSHQEIQELPAGEWCFEPEQGELVYRPRHDRHLHLVGGGGEAELLRWKVIGPSNGDSSQNPAFLGLNVHLLTPYIWFGD